jgi:3-oxoacyl-[acyl-carrier protein] reductase
METNERSILEINLSEDVAIVTGVGKGIGRDVLIRLALEGVKTVGIDTNSADLDSLKGELSEIGGEHSQYVGDVRDGARIRQIVREVDERYGRIDILVNNAGVAGNGLISDLSEEVWDLSHDVNLKGTFLACQAVLPAMKRRLRGRIINAASFAAIVPLVGSVAYASSKAAVAHFTRGLAGEVGPYNITVNAYAPGMVPTTLNKFDLLDHKEQSQLLDTLSLRSWGEKQDIANLVCFLASDQARYITGTLIDISGGKLATQIPKLAYELSAEEGARPLTFE